MQPLHLKPCLPLPLAPLAPPQAPGLVIHASRKPSGCLVGLFSVDLGGGASIVSPFIMGGRCPRACVDMCIAMISDFGF